MVLSCWIRVSKLFPDTVTTCGFELTEVVTVMPDTPVKVVLELADRVLVEVVKVSPTDGVLLTWKRSVMMFST